MTNRCFQAASRRTLLHIGVLFLLAVWTTGCKKEVNSLKSFTQQGNRTLFQLTDKEGQSWKVLSAEMNNRTNYLILNSTGNVDIAASVGKTSDGTKSAVVFVDSAEKEQALAILDKQFLAGLTHSRDDYKKWLEKNAVFSYGAVELTATFDLKKGGLGSGDVRVENGNIVAPAAPQANCFCAGNPRCSLPGDPLKQECWDACCRYVNCICNPSMREAGTRVRMNIETLPTSAT